MPLAKSKQSVGLGNSLMNDRFGKGRGSDRKRTTAVTRTQKDTGETYVINEKQDAAWVKMRSVTEQGALDDFLATAELAGTDFTAEKMNNVKIIHTDQKNPYLLSSQEERAILGKHRMHRARLTVPRRPNWDASTTPRELDLKERESFMNWRRGLAELQENNDLLMTPFERNLEVWRQLWRVIERSDLVVQIVDARNPLLFRSEDLETYVKAVGAQKQNLLLINKADMMTLKQRQAWAKHLREARIPFKFFSAHLANEQNEARYDSDEDDPPTLAGSAAGKQARRYESPESAEESDEEGGVSTRRDDTDIITVEELEDIFLQHTPQDAEADHKLQVGLVGYPNVGKSSTINALIGSKKVSVSSTPGKTKHFQTIHLSERVILCDCPGLVFPNFATTKADLVCNGVLPIDQMRGYHGPCGLVTQRIPKRFLEGIYGITIKMRSLEEGGTGEPTSEELLRAYATARGFQTQGLGQPDESRAARYILKDYVNGKLLFVHPPPEIEDATAFNAELYSDLHLPAKRRAVLVSAESEERRKTLASVDAAGSDFDDMTLTSDTLALPAGPKTHQLDKQFFGPKGTGGHMKMPFSHKYTDRGSTQDAAPDSRMLNGRKAKSMIALENGLDPKDVQIVSGKKHFKKNTKGKKRGIRLDGD